VAGWLRRSGSSIPRLGSFYHLLEHARKKKRAVLGGRGPPFRVGWWGWDQGRVKGTRPGLLPEGGKQPPSEPIRVLPARGGTGRVFLGSATRREEFRPPPGLLAAHRGK
jgi:hypothetical protein